MSGDENLLDSQDFDLEDALNELCPQGALWAA